MSESEHYNIRRAADRTMQVKDWLQIALLVGALVAQYVAISNRITALETKVSIIYDERRGVR